MKPVLFSIGSLPVSSFGLFLALSFIAAVFACWRIAKTYDLNEEKILDLMLLTFFGGLIGARIYFIIFHLYLINDFWKMILINKYPGLSFWGGFMGGALTLWFFTRRFKLGFWQIADFASIGFLLGLIIGNIGCFLGGCQVGIPSTLPIATNIIGLLDKRLPISLIESLFFLIIFYILWGQVIKFHFQGKITALFLILVGAVKLISEFYYAEKTMIPYLNIVTTGNFFSVLIIVSGTVVFYKKSRRKLFNDLAFVVAIFVSNRERKAFILHLGKNWYNLKINLQISGKNFLNTLGKLPKLLQRRLNVRSTPTNT